MAEEKKKKRKKKISRFATSFSMRFDSFTLDMLDRIAWDEDKTRPEVIRSAVKFLFLKKYSMEELEGLREKHRSSLFLDED
jgi:predicted transcriptional regulator